MADLALYLDAFWISPYPYTCFVALKEKGLAFDVHEVPLNTGAQHDPAYRDHSLTGRVPALRHGDFWLSESTAIVEYLEDAFPDTARVLPRDAKDRARARQIMAWVRSDLDKLREERSTQTMFYTPATEPLTAAGRAAADKLVRIALAVVPEGRDTLFADGFSVADADLAFVLHRLILNKTEVPARLHAYATQQWQRPSVRGFVDHARVPFVPYF